VSVVDSYAGRFSLATGVEAHPAETLVEVTVSESQSSRLVLDFSDEEQVLTDARVLLCGHVGAQVLLEMGYTGPLARRPRLADPAGSKASGRPATEQRQLK
jgi:predicted xylose isomerase-like sugar epimerase